jgi:hypothetical protein
VEQEEVGVVVVICEVEVGAWAVDCARHLMVVVGWDQQGVEVVEGVEGVVVVEVEAWERQGEEVG